MHSDIILIYKLVYATWDIPAVGSGYWPVSDILQLRELRSEDE